MHTNWEEVVDLRTTFPMQACRNDQGQGYMFLRRLGLYGFDKVRVMCCQEGQGYIVRCVEQGGFIAREMIDLIGSSARRIGSSRGK